MVRPASFDPVGLPPVHLGAHYVRTRQRVTTLLAGTERGVGATPVPACPGWTVHDVVAHLVGNIEDGVAGRIEGVPTTEQTEQQVARHRDEDLAALLETWTTLSPLFEAALTEHQIWPGMLDAVSHEHDIRAALDQPGAREEDTIALAADVLVASLDVPATVAVTFPDGRTTTVEHGGGTFELCATAFDVLRFRLGRRSREQVAAMDWSRDPEPILDRLFVFGPSANPQLEPG